MSKYPSQTQDKFTVRFPDGLRDAIAKRAEENGRSMNSEIVQILQDVLDAGVSHIDPNMSPEDAQATFEDGIEEFRRLLTKKQEEILNTARVVAKLISSNKKAP
ncbi:Arc family DNA-binding protein [Xenorhabdus bovienii]|uniref:Arc family DNA-binding protein n=1 Tax=Xenorhabdus bovienii TaxID=40576 RepID=UPI001EDE8584|nr:Arc family DNA-binding protein [Xenorhabdus bovienii]MCG3462733.1 Arc family DNA-binding protein [Xenorhabdus bovienii]